MIPSGLGDTRKKVEEVLEEGDAGLTDQAWAHVHVSVDPHVG